MYCLMRFCCTVCFRFAPRQPQSPTRWANHSNSASWPTVRTTPSRTPSTAVTIASSGEQPTVPPSWVSGRASFWGHAYTVRKWTRNLRTKIRKSIRTKITEKWRISSNDSARNVRKRCTLSFHNTRPWSFALCAVWDVLRLNPALCVRCTHHSHDFAHS